LNSIQQEDFTHYQQATAAPVIAMLAKDNQSSQNEIWNKVTEAAKKHSYENDNAAHRIYME